MPLEPTVIIPPAADGDETNPPCGGRWIRDADGSLYPADAGTAASAAQALGLVDDGAPELANPDPVQE